MNAPEPSNGWTEAAWLVARWLAERERFDALLERVPDLAPVERTRCQQLVFAVVRHFGRIEAGLDGASGRPPRYIVRAILFLLGAEWIEMAADDPGRAARIVHHAVERAKALASAPEARLVNAVGRKLTAFLAAQAVPGPAAPNEAFAAYYSHPAWLVARWRQAFGAEGLRRLLEWNQQTGRVFARWRPPAPAAPPGWLQATPWPEYLQVDPGNWAEVEAALKGGLLYVQDPGSRLAVDVLEPRAGETWLDACAAPGGKSLLIADRAGTGRLIATDPDRDRLVRLEENLAQARGVEVEVARLDLLDDPGGTLKEAKLPAGYDAVLVDAPCSNSGVMRHRVDVKWRLQPADFRRHARRQKMLLDAAAGLVVPGGRLVYSTCSVDPEENEGVVDAFCRDHPEFAVEAAVTALPWEAGNDGAGVFRLRRRA